jgi:diguanylate cyclase (GGDEF)-like protein/PAS domain S-box-containing protein
MTEKPTYEDLEQRIRELEEEYNKGKQGEEALRESEAKYRNVVENAQEAIFIAQDVKLVFVNRAAMNLTGYSEEIFKSSPFTDFIYPDDRNMVVNHHLRRLTGEEVPPTYSFRIVRQDGTVRWVELSAAIVSWKGKPATLNFLSDITERKRAEEALRESEEEQRLLIKTLPIAVFVHTQGKIVYVNPAFLTLYKASSPDEVIGMRLIDFVPPELFDTIEERRRIMTEENRILPPLELNLRCMDGTVVTVVSTSMPIVFQEQPSVLAALYDITERKRREIELQKAHKLLQIQVRTIEDLRAKLKEQVIRDPLTGLFNRRYLEETLGRELARAKREGFPIGMVMIDIDHFKQVNDSHGHKAGDLILQALGRLLLGGIRAGDIAYRYGGEEFLLILPQASRSITAARAEQWRTGFEALNTVYGEKALQSTISLGVAVYPADGVTVEAVIHAADQAMYRAKALGRNRVVLSLSPKES